ncbi:MAG: hypothetical protein QGG71_24055 [Pirellulaceae bacterium]|nr:hypothetical protein [Pirellulaceae bacterium]
MDDIISRNKRNAALLALLVSTLFLTAHFRETTSDMTVNPKLSLDHVPQLSMQGLAAALGAPEKTFEFTLDENVSEFRIPLLNKFSSAQVKEGAIRLTEVTFELDEKNYLTVWFNGTQYVDHFAYDKLTDF